MDKLKQQRIKRQIQQSLNDIEQLQAQLAHTRRCAQELAQLMRQIREDSQRARTQEAARQRREKIRLVG